MRRRAVIALASLALAAPVAAYASTVQTRTGAETTKIEANGCKVVVIKSTQAISVDCPTGHWATLHWSVVGPFHAAVTIASAHPLKYPFALTCGPGFKHPIILCDVAQRVHQNTITSLTATFS